MVALRAVESSSVAAIGFDPEVSTLHVRFHSGGTYAYFGVPASVHRDFVEADSIGRFFTERIRDRYPTRRVG